MLLVLERFTGNLHEHHALLLGPFMSAGFCVSEMCVGVPLLLGGVGGSLAQVLSVWSPVKNSSVMQRAVNCLL